MKLEERLARSISDQLDQVLPPRPDLASAVGRGRALRRRRRVGSVLALTFVVSGGLLAAQGLGAFDSGRDGFGPKPQEFQPVGQLEFDDGLRAYMSPDRDGEIWLGGRAFPVGQLDHIDTDATATPYGMVFFDRTQRARLLREDGAVVPLAAAPVGPNREFHPSSKADAELPLVAWTELGGSVVNVRLFDLSTGIEVDNIEVECAGADCLEVKVDAVDQGLVFVRTVDGTYVWDPSGVGAARWTQFSDPDTKVADARNKRILYTGREPSPAPVSPIDSSWAFTAGEIDAQLSLDGGHVLYWSTRLDPTTPDGRPIQLDAPSGAYVQVTFDTDGSVLVALPDASSPMTSLVFDCVIPAGSCTELPGIKTESGDPIFIGNDM